jgi:TPR repeat protein
MPDALYAVGIFYTEDLVVPADWMKARDYLQRSAQGGSEAGKTALDEFTRRGLFGGTDSIRTASNAPADTLRPKVPPLMLLDFETDTLTEARPEQLDLLISRNALQLRTLLGVEREDTDTSRPALETIRSAAEYGSPEARTLLGRCYETGTGCGRDLLQAAEEYLNALRVDAPKAYDLLWTLAGTAEFREAFTAGSRSDDGRSKFVSAGLAGVRIDLRVTDRDAVQLLREAAARGHVSAILELGIRYSSGRGVARDRAQALALWSEAARSGSREAEIRLAMARVLEGDSFAVRQTDVEFLADAAGRGSVLAQLALGFCHERGIGMREDRGEAARWYRKAARRGHQAAYLSLRHLHDEIRPDEPEFRML